MCSSSSSTAVREVLSRADRQKEDSSDDSSFYNQPRLVQHVDDSFRKQLTELYRQRVPAGGTILDLCSSWVSHLPSEVVYSKVVGHGLNAQELARNKQLNTFFVRNLNKEPDGWALASNSMDAVLCTVSVQYLQQPERVFAEVYRVLSPGGVCIISFSNRMFYSKAIKAWRDTSPYGRTSLVKQYFQCIPGFTEPHVVTKVEARQQKSGLAAAFEQLKQSLSFKQGQDPFNAVIAYKDYVPSRV